MVKVLQGAPASAVEGYTLYVEGGSGKAIDPHLIKHLLRDLNLSVHPMGSAYNIANVATAFSPKINESNKKLMFLIDRDHRTDVEVNGSWREFLKPLTPNLLIWKKREFENYFLEPDYLARSEFLACAADKLKNQILERAKERVYLDLSNLVIIRIREELKQDWINLFTNPASFTSLETALKKLKARNEFKTKLAGTKGSLGVKNLENMFREVSELFFKGETTPHYGKGNWLDMIRGKKVLAAVINKCFKVQRTDGKYANGEERLRKVLENLMSLPLSGQPDDFQALHKKIKQKISS